MTTPFIFDKCILCLENTANTREHIIPDCIGGRLQYKILCAKCNSTLGSELISKVKTDPSIRLAVSHLKDEIPEMFERVENGQKYSAMDKNRNRVLLKYKDGEIKVMSREKEDGSVIWDMEDAPAHIKRLLEKERLTDDETETKIDIFEKLGNDVVIPLAKGLNIMKGFLDQDSVQPVLDGPSLDNRIPALIAYEFLSLAQANSIYDSRFDFIRDFIINGISSESLIVEWLMSKEYSSFHKIYLGLTEKETVVTIVFFRWLVYRVRMKDLILSCPEFIYYEDLKSKKSAVAKSIGEAKQGNYYLF